MIAACGYVSTAMPFAWTFSGQTLLVYQWQVVRVMLMTQRRTCPGCCDEIADRYRTNWKGGDADKFRLDLPTSSSSMPSTLTYTRSQ